MSRQFSEEQVLEMLRSRVGWKGGSKFAASLGVSPAFVSNVLTGQKRPTQAMLDLIGVEKVTIYRKKALQSASDDA